MDGVMTQQHATAADWDFLKFRKQHGRLVKVEATIAFTSTGRRTRISHLRDVASARLLDGLSDPQLEALCFLRAAIKTVSGQMDYKPPQWFRLDRSSGNPADTTADLSGMYWRWLDACAAEKADPRPACFVAGYGMTTRQMEFEMRMTRRTIMDHFRSSLDILDGMRETPLTHNRKSA